MCYLVSEQEQPSSGRFCWLCLESLVLVLLALECCENLLNSQYNFSNNILGQKNSRCYPEPWDKANIYILCSPGMFWK